MYFPVFWDERYAIQKIKTGMHGCVQLDTCNWWDGGIKGTCRVICGSYVGRRLQNDNEHAILTNCSQGVAMKMTLMLSENFPVSMRILS